MSSDFFGDLTGIVVILCIIAAVIGLTVLKGIALWRAARNGHKGWFIAIFSINLLGILETIYLLSTGKKASAPPDGALPPAPEKLS